MPLDVDRLAETLVAGTRALIAKAMAPLLQRIEELTAEKAKVYDVIGDLDGRLVVLAAGLKELPTPEQLEALQRGLEAAVSAIGAREAPEAPDIPAMVLEAVSDAMARRETPDMGPIVAEAVRVAVEALPEPPGKNADPVELESLVASMSADLWAAMESLRQDMPAPVVLPDPPDLTGLATKDEVDAAIKAIPSPPDLAGYATKEDLEETTAVMIAAFKDLPLPPDVTGFATKADVEAVRGAIPDVAGPMDSLLDSFAEAISEVRAAIPEPADLTGFATKDDLSGMATTGDIDAVRSAIPAMPDLAGYATKADLAAIPTPEPGRPGAGVAEVRQNEDGELIVKLTNGETHNAGKVRGADGFGFEDMRTEWDGERTLKIIFTRGERTDVTSLKLPVPIDRGVWREHAYERADVVSWGGSAFIAQRDTEPSDRPETSDAWRLSIKRGRDARSTENNGAKR